MDVEDEVERLENNPDVVDIVATYADLQAYDTSTLTDKDVIRVLTDSTHNNNSTFYRWNATTNQFDYIGEVTSGPTVVQTTGTSTTDVMSQDATTKMVFSDTGNRVKIGNNISLSSVGNSLYTAIGSYSRVHGHSTAIGAYSDAGEYGVAIASGVINSVSATSGESAVAIGVQTNASGLFSVALGRGATAPSQGQFDISTGPRETSGYNNSNYRLLTGLYDPQNAHDAATKGYVDGLVGNIESALNTINNGTGA